MRKEKIKKYLVMLLLICVVCVSSVFSVNASPKVRSKSVALNVQKATIGIGDIVTLDAVMKPTNSTDTIKWSSSNKKVADVNKYGVVTAVGEGSATITAKTSSKKKAICVVTVKKQLSEEEVSALISKECLSEETIKRLIKENTLSEADVKKIVAANSGGEVSGSNTDWEDGTELKMLSNQNLPYSENGITIEKITVRKYHYNGEWDGRPQKYKYTLEVEGSLSDDFDSSMYYPHIKLQYMSSHGYESDNFYYYTLYSRYSYGNVNSTYSEKDGKFVFMADQYGIYGDYDEYIIYDLIKEPYW